MAAPDTTAHKLDDDFDLMDWINRNGRNVAIGAGILVVLGGGFWLYTVSASRKEAFASQELMQARSSAESGNLPLAASDLTKLIERFGGTRAADEAVIVLNQVRLVQGQRDVAVNALQEFVRSNHDDQVTASAYGLLGAGLEDQGKRKEAGDAYREASRAARLDFLKASYLIDAGRAYTTAGDSTSAKSAYAEILDKFGRLDQAAEARVRMAELGGTVPPPPAPIDSTDD